jgi:hypothetical protein
MPRWLTVLLGLKHTSTTCLQLIFVRLHGCVRKMYSGNFNQPDAEDSESDSDEGSQLGLEHVEPPSTERSKGRPRTKRRRTGDVRAHELINGT